MIRGRFDALIDQVTYRGVLFYIYMSRCAFIWTCTEPLSLASKNGKMFHILGTSSPKESQNTKYSANVRGGYSASSFKNYKLPPSVVNSLVKASNQSLALTTWSSYKTAESHLRKCEIDTNVKIRFPMDDREMLYNFLIGLFLIIWADFLYWFYVNEELCT